MKFYKIDFILLGTFAFALIASIALSSYELGRREIRAEAIKNQFAEYHSDEYGSPTFAWKVNPRVVTTMNKQTNNN